MQSARHWEVDREYFDPIYNYLVHGYSPGSFFTSLLANDAMGAIQRSHPANQIPNLKNLVGWIQDKVPAIAYGSYELVQGWLDMTDDQRRPHLEGCGLIYTEYEEVEMALRGVKTTEPVFF